MSDTQKKISLEEILAEVKAKSKNTQNEKSTSDVMSSMADSHSAINTLDVYIKFGQADKSVEEITNEIKFEMEKSAMLDSDNDKNTDNKIAEKPTESKPEQVHVESKTEHAHVESKPEHVHVESKPEHININNKTDDIKNNIKQEIHGQEKPVKHFEDIGTLEKKIEEKEPVNEPVKNTLRDAQAKNQYFTKQQDKIAIDDSPTQSFSSNEILSDEIAQTRNIDVPKRNKIFDTFTGKTAGINTELVKQKYDSEQRRQRRLEEFFTINEEPNEKEKKIKEVRQKEIYDFENYEDAENFGLMLSSKVSKGVFRFITLTILAVCSLYISFSSLFGIGVIESLSLQTEPLTFTMVQLIICLIAAIASFKTIGGGLMSALTFTKDTDSLLAVSFLGALIHNFYLLLSPEILSNTQNLIIYTPIAVFALCINSFGKLLKATRIKRNFKLVSSKYEKYATRIVDSEQVVPHLNRLSTYSGANAAVSVESEFLTDYYKYSDSSEPSEKFNKTSAPIMLLLALILGLFSYFTTQNIYTSITLGVGLLVITCPFVTCLSTSLILNRLSNKLFKKGAVVTGYEAVETLADTNGVIIDAKDLFPIGTVTLHGVKTFGTERIDECILSVASVVYAAKGTYSDMFLEVIEGKTDILKKVDSYVYEDGMGVSAWIDSRRVLIGNSQLLKNHGIDVPSKDYEDRYMQKSRELMYLSVSGTLSAMFILKYTPDENIKNSLDKLERAGYDIFIKTNDSNITAQKISEIYEVNSEILKIIPGSAYNDLAKITDKSPSSPALAVHTGSFAAFASAIYGCARVKSAIKFSVILQIISVIFCTLVMLFIALTNASSSIYNIGVFFVLQLFWSALILILPNSSDI